MAKTEEGLGLVTVLGARLSFASLFETNKQTQDDGSVRETWKANGLLDKAACEAGEIMAIYKGEKMPVLKALKQASLDVKKAKWGDNVAKHPKIKADKVFLRDGDEENWDGYEGCWYFSANAQAQNPPQVLTNRMTKDPKTGKKKWIRAEPGGASSPYSGCYCNFILQIWVQDNKHGQRVNAELKTVQFLRDGEPFSAGRVDSDELLTEDMVGELGDVGDDFPEDEDDLV